ncbi:MAG: hypothetical protein Q8936_08685 [Bacillota bacterium]|nr:hypothetical protein [Bacillota bacterium]
MYTLLFFLLLVGISLYFISSLFKKISFQKQQIIYLTRQNDSLKSKIEKNMINFDSIAIKYIESNGANAAAKITSYIYLAPICDFTIAWKVEKDTLLDIIDCAEIKNIKWYEVCYLSDESTKIKGWIPASNLIFLNDYS